MDVASLAFLIQHQSESLLSAETGVTTHGADTPDGLITRIIAAYQLAGPSKDAAGESMWSVFLLKNIEVHNALLEGDTKKVSRMLADPSKTELFYGFDSLFAERVRYRAEHPEYVRWETDWEFDTLLRVAEATGAIRLENPEDHDPATSSPRLTPDQTLQALDKVFGFEIPIPCPYPHASGLKTSRGILTNRDIHAIFQAWRIKELLKESGGRTVLEIGAGLGRTAYYARHFGINDYTIVDLPLTNVSQAHFLGAMLGQDAITLHGEQPREGSIKIMQPGFFLEGAAQEFDLILNADSFTEIDAKIAKRYWSRIKKSTKLFLSINHEQNRSTVRDFINDCKSVRRASRNPYWLRLGYVEEVVEFKKKKPPAPQKKRPVKDAWRALRRLLGSAQATAKSSPPKNEAK